MDPAQREARWRLRPLLWGLLFSLAYSQAPLYTSNQNQYFLHGAAAAGIGTLRQDWLANTADPTPLFSLLVRLSYLLPPPVFHLEYLALLALYAWAMLGVASSLADLQGRRRALFLAGLVLTHSAALRFLLGRLPGSHWAYLLEGGVAGQRLLGEVLQPSAFGVLLVLSVLFYLRGRPFAAALSAALAASVHPTYLLTAGLLTLTYLAHLARAGQPRRALAVGAAALAAVLPILAYVTLTFRPSSPEAAADAARVLVEVRIPHHAVPAAWFDATVVVKVGLVLAALWLARRTPLAPVLAVPALGAALLTLAQVLTGSHRLALLFPWRVSALLVPLATAVLLARAVEALPPGGAARLARLALPLAALLALAGLADFVLGYRRQAADPARPMMAHVAATRAPGQVYLIPPRMQDFRLATGAPAVVDFKSIPYRDVEVLAWYGRLQVAQWFYRDRAEEVDCDLLPRAAAEFGATHVVLPAHLRGLACPALGPPLYDDGAYSLHPLEP